MACRPVRGVNLAVQGHRLALEGAALVAAPFEWGAEWTPTSATFALCLPLYRSFVQALPGVRIALFSARFFVTLGVVALIGMAESHWRS
jgi:hypothetical protein